VPPPLGATWGPVSPRPPATWPSSSRPWSAAN